MVTEQIAAAASLADMDPVVLPVTPVLASNLSLTKRIFEAIEASGVPALVLIGYATGTTPSALNPLIKHTVESGVPVVVLSDNRGEDQGPQRLKYATQVEAVEAGATPLKDVNVNDVEQVAAAIRKAAQAGKTGQDLAESLVAQYGTPTREY